ncbi:MAG: neutral zinc metallopeptidase [Thermomicrobiales bacterium]
MNAFWRETFSAAGMAYHAPRVQQVDRRMASGCNELMDPNEENAFYCTADETVYLFPKFMQSQANEFGDYAPFTIIGHEWGHHVQWLARAPYNDSRSFELQADCLSGAFMDYVETHGLLDEGDFIEAILQSFDSGDDANQPPGGLPADNRDAHGSSEERVKALMKGYGGGPAKCGLALTGVGGPAHVPDPDPTPVARAPQEPPDGPATGAPRLPVSLPLAHARCFSQVGGDTVSWSELLERFSGVAGAAERLQGWGWQASAYRQFGCDGPPSGEAGWIEITVHGFGSATAAREAADFFAAARLDGAPLRYAEAPAVGDYAVALTGAATNGTEFTIYASDGPWLVRVTGVSPYGGAPAVDVRDVVAEVLAAQKTGGSTSGPVVNVPATPGRPSLTLLPSSPDVPHAACFRSQGSGPNREQDVVAAFNRTGIGSDAMTTYGWQDGAWIVFKCGNPPPGRADQIDVSIHQFRDASAAREIASVVEDFQRAGAHESRDCGVADAYVICVTAYAESGMPAADMRFVLNQVLASAR